MPDILGEGSTGLTLAEVGLVDWEIEVVIEVGFVSEQVVEVMACLIAGRNGIVLLIVVKIHDTIKAGHSTHRSPNFEGIAIMIGSLVAVGAMEGHGHLRPAHGLVALSAFGLCLRRNLLVSCLLLIKSLPSLHSLVVLSWGHKR